MISFEEPLMLMFFIPLIGLGVVSFFWRGRGGRLQFSLGSWKGNDFNYSPRWLKGLMLFRTSAFYFGLSLIILALAGPSFLRREQVFLSQGTNFMVVLDISPSMKGDDFAPETRFDSALRVIRQFLETREKDPIGLVTFATTATPSKKSTNCPVSPSRITSRTGSQSLAMMADSQAIASIKLQLTTKG
jgi:Ca-activated chloride channel family protein